MSRKAWGLMDTNGERTTENMACRKVTGEKLTVEEGGQWDKRGEKFM